jgi:parallel beta-helix repeat protein
MTITQQVVDNTPGAGESAFSAFSKVNANDAALFNAVNTAASTYTPPGTGAVPTTVAQKLQQSLSVFDYMTSAQQNNVALNIGSLDVSAAITVADAAATASGKNLFFPPGVYGIAPPVGAGASTIHGTGCSWQAASRDAATLKSLSGAYLGGQRMISWAGLSNFTIEHIGFDFSAANCAGPNGSPCEVLLAFQCTDFAFRDVSVLGISDYVLGLFINDTASGTNWAVTDSYFQNSTPSVHQSQAINIQTSTNQHQVSRNICVGTGIFSNAANGLYSENIVSGWKFGGGLVLGPLAACINNRVIGNYCFNGGTAIDDNATYPSGVECWSPYTIVMGNTCNNNGGAGIVLGGSNCVVKGNQCLNNSQAGTPLGGIIAYGIPGFSASNSIITGNQLSDNQGSPTQQYGYKEYPNVGGSAPITGVLFCDNVALGNVVSPFSFGGTTPAQNQMNGALYVQSQVPTSAGTSATPVILFGSASGFGVYWGSGVPSFSAAQGSLYLRSDGSSGSTRAYINSTVGGGTSWTAITTAA